MASGRRALAVLVNPTSAGGRPLELLPAVEAELRRLGTEFRVVHTASAENARELAAEARDAGETVAGLGGDGLIGTIAQELRGAEVPLAVLPGGRGNDLARVLGIPTDPAAAAQVAVEGVERRIDVGEVDGRAFLGIASCGFDSDASRIANEARLVHGNLVYAYAALRALAAWRPATFELTVDGERHMVPAISMGVANSKAYGGGMYAVPHAELDDGLLDPVWTYPHSRMRFLLNLRKLFDGSHADRPEFGFLRGREIELAADRPFTVYADGDPIAELPARIRVAERVLGVLVPPG